MFLHVFLHLLGSDIFASLRVYFTVCFLISYALQFWATFPGEVRSALGALVSWDNGFVITKTSFLLSAERHSI